jgi:excinuclease ABC subunit C
MRQVSLEENYEEAKRLRNQIIVLRKIVDFPLILFKKEEKIEKRIEGYDVSNLGDEIIVGSMVVFMGAKPIKSEYKKFRVKRKGQSDVDSLKEIISRRLKHKEWKLPDLVSVDGGKPQVNAIKSLFSIDVVGIAKGKKRDKNKIVYFGNDNWVYENMDILISVRDEAHRFAINYQRNLKIKKTFK